MLASTLEVSCSKRCELLLALTCVLAPQTLIPIASRLATDQKKGALHLARALSSLAPEHARELSLRTLAEAGMSVDSGKKESMTTRFFNQLVGRGSRT